MYLDYAERGVEALESFTRDSGTREVDSPFEEQVSRELRSRGYDVRHQVGCGRFRIDLALIDPQQRGRYVLGIECDGATYHSSATARDRDRLRQSVLEQMGWRICRIWSTDWIRDPNRQIARVIAEYEQSLHTTPAEPAAKSPDPAPGSVVSADTHTRKANGTSRPALPQYYYQQIEDVPLKVVQDLAHKLLELHGATEKQELVVAIARRLGFERTGSKIKQRISMSIRDLLRDSVLSMTEDERVCIGEP